MNSMARITAAVTLQASDRAPVIPQVFGHAAVLAGVPLDQYLQDGALLARCQLQALDYYGYDAVFALMDVNVETEALGSVLNFRPDQYPTISAYALSLHDPLDALAVPDPHRAGRMPELLKAASLLRQAVGDDVLVVGCVLGPMTIATQLLGLEAALNLAIDQPDRFGRLLDFTTAVAIRFGTAQLAAGAHLPIVFDPASTPEVIPAQFYREFVLPRLQQVFAAFKAAGSAANWLHTAGATIPILPYYPQAGVELANIDYCVDPQAALQALPNTCIDGNIKPLAFVTATPAVIDAEATRLLDLFAPRGGFILSSGCEIPPEAQPANIKAMVTAAGGR